MKMIKQLLSVAIIAMLSMWLTGCTGQPITFKSVDPKSYADVKDKGRTITASASGFQLFLVIPIGINTRHAKAYDNLLKQANGDYITDVKIEESWTYAFVGTSYRTTITATAYPKK